MRPTDFAIHLSRFLGNYLLGQSGVSVNTIRSYRDTFTLFLRYCKDEQALPPQKLTFACITHTLIEQFLLWLEEERNNCASTRNSRLAALHAFYRYLQIELPQMLGRCQEILAIPYKKTQKKVMSYLTLEGVKMLLEQPDASTVSGQRDRCLLSLLYDTGARVQELCDLQIKDVRLSSPTVIRLTGKGAKARLVPIMLPTELLLRHYLNEFDADFALHGGYPLFCNRMGKKLTRAGVTYILQKYLSQAQFAEASCLPDSISPHCLRHTFATRLVEQQVPIRIIQELLGHSSVTTTMRCTRWRKKRERRWTA